MSTHTGTPQKTNRRFRRQQQIESTSSTSPRILSSQDAELSTDTNPDKRLDQPTRILRRGEIDIAPEPTLAVNLQLPSHTPPRPRSMYEGHTAKQHTGSDSAPNFIQNRKRNYKAQGRKQSGSTPPIRTPVSTPKHQSLTPNRANETPSRAYAGPTFHASPAASSLPMPKFFSKSMPNVDKTSSLKSMMEQEAPEIASESEGSPSQENIQPAHDHRTRETSPLDVFFRADEKAKAKARPIQESAIKGFDGQAGLSASPSEPQTPNRHHSRHPTDSSIGGMFPLEMDGVPPEVTRNETPNHEPAIKKSSSAAEVDLTEEQRKAKTAAFKQMLYSNRPPLPHDGSAGHRPPSSNLRQELTMPTSPGGISKPPQLPATPTLSHVHNPFVSSRTQYQQCGYVSPYSPFTPSKPQSQASSPAQSRDNRNKKSLEDDLRRILKLEVLGGDGVSQIRS